MPRRGSSIEMGAGRVIAIDKVPERLESGVRGEIPGTRRMVLKPFVLTVRLGKNGVEIAAVRHGSRKDAHEPSELIEDNQDEVEIPSGPKR